MNQAMNHPHEILIADAAVADLHILLDGLAPHVAVHLIQPGEDVIAGIFDALSDPALRKLHLLAHGAPGGIIFGGKQINAADFLGRYDGAMQRDLDIAFWSCSTGAGEQGQAFVRAVAQATGARVSAASGLVGASNQGGTWELGARVAAPFNATARALFPHALATGIIFYPEYPDGLGTFYDLASTLQGILNTENGNNFSYNVYGVRLMNAYDGNVASDINTVIALSNTRFWSAQVDATRLTSLTGTAADMVTLFNAVGYNQIIFSGTETVTVSGTVTVAQAAVIDAGSTGAITLTNGVSDTIANLTGHTTVGENYRVVDTVANLAAGLNGSIETHATSINILDTIANIIAGTGGAVETAAATFSIIDTAANVLANASNVAVTGASTITLVPGDTTLNNLSALDAVTLFDTLHAVRNGNSYTVTDTAAGLLAYGADPALTGASSITLAAHDGTLSGISVASALILFDNLHAGLNGNTYTIIDSAENLLNYWWDGAVSNAASITLAANDTTLAGISVGAAQALFDHLHASLNGNTYSITDSGAALLSNATDAAVTGATTIALQSSDTTLSDLPVASAITLFDTLHAELNGNSYTITDTGTALLAAATDAAVTGAATITLALNDSSLTSISVNQAVTLFDTLHAVQNGNVYGITDTGTALIASAGDAAVTGAATITLAPNDSTVAGLSVASAITLFDTLHAAQNGNLYTITDTAADLLAAMSDGAVTGAASITLAPNDNALAGISVSTAAALFDTLQAALNGNTYSITDTGAALLTSATDPAVTGATTITLAAGDVTLSNLSVVSAITLFDTLHAAQNGNTYAITDTAANLVPHATDTAVTGASSLTLAAGDSSLAGISVSGAMTLFDTLHAGLNGNTYSIADTAAHLMASANDAAVTGATALGLSTDASLSLADAATLTGLANFSLNGHQLNLADSLANLAGNTGEFGATSYSVVDSAANILAASADLLVTGATAVGLSADATLSVADATTLSALNSFSTDGHALHLTDSIANLTGHLSTAGASSHGIIDTAADILAAATGSIVTTATSLSLSADASVSVADAGTLSGLANFSLNGHALSLADSIANLSGNLATGGATGYSVVDSAANIAQFNSTDSTWTVNSLIHDGTAVNLTDAISPSELAAIEATDPSGAVTIVPTSLSAPNAFMIADTATPSFNIAYGTVAEVIAAPGAETIDIAFGGKLKLTGTDGHDTIIFEGYQPGSLVMTQSGTTAIFTDATTHATVAAISMDSTFASEETIQYADGSQVLVTLVGTPLTLHLTPIHA